MATQKVGKDDSVIQKAKNATEEVRKSRNWRGVTKSKTGIKCGVQYVTRVAVIDCLVSKVT